MPELEIGLLDGCELSFNPSFLNFNVKKKIEVESYSQFDFKCWILGSGSLKLVSAIFYQIFIFAPNDSPSKSMKSVFYFI